MSDITAGTALRMVKTFKFDVPICKQYFPDGITNKHVVLAMDKPEDGRITVMVVGWYHIKDQHPSYGWNNPQFRIPVEYVEVASA